MDQGWVALGSLGSGKVAAASYIVTDRSRLGRIVGRTGRGWLVPWNGRVAAGSYMGEGGSLHNLERTVRRAAAGSYLEAAMARFALIQGRKSLGYIESLSGRS